MTVRSLRLKWADDIQKALDNPENLDHPNYARVAALVAELRKIVRNNEMYAVSSEFERENLPEPQSLIGWYGFKEVRELGFLAHSGFVVVTAERREDVAVFLSFNKDRAWNLKYAVRQLEQTGLTWQARRVRWEAAQSPHLSVHTIVDRYAQAHETN